MPAAGGAKGKGLPDFWSNFEDLKKRYLPPSCKGEKILAFGLTEPDAGSNPLEMTTTYDKQGDHFVLNGVKYLISNAGIASYGTVLQVDPEAARITVDLRDNPDNMPCGLNLTEGTAIRCLVRYI